MKFNNKIFLPIIKKYVRIEPLINKHYFELSKFITNNDDEGITYYLDLIVNNVLLDKTLTNKLSNLDKFIIILNSKIISSGSKISIIGDNNIKTEFSLVGIINNIIKNIKDFEFEKLIISEDLEIIISLPKNFIISDIDQIYKEIINKIKTKDEIIYFNNLTEDEKDDIINIIPVSLTGDIIDYITKTQDLFKKISLIQENSKLGTQNIPLNVFDNTLFMFMKSLFGENLKNYYELQYILCTKLHFSINDYMSLTPNDCKIFINLYSEDMKKQQEEQEKSTSNSIPKLPSIPSMPKM